MRKLLQTLKWTLTAALLLAGAPMYAGEWVWPTLDTSEPQTGELTVTTRYVYKLYVAEGAQELPVLDRPAATLETPVDALIARMSALRKLDYDWWLSLWDKRSRELYQEKDRREGRNRDYWLTLWKAQFRDARILVRKKIEYGKYTIFTYSVLSKTGQDIGGGIEFPLVLAKEDGNWKVTLDLRANPLLSESPWYSGIAEKTIQVN